MQSGVSGVYNMTAFYKTAFFWTFNEPSSCQFIIKISWSCNTSELLFPDQLRTLYVTEQDIRTQTQNMFYLQRWIYACWADDE